MASGVMTVAIMAAAIIGVAIVEAVEVAMEDGEDKLAVKSNL